MPVGINQAITGRLGLDTSSWDSGWKRAGATQQSATQRMRAGFRRVATAAVIVVTAIAAIGAATAKMSQAGGKAITIQAAFINKTRGQVGALQEMRDATNGLVSDMELMTQANVALTLGSAENATQFAELAKTAQTLGRALGLDTAFALNSLNIGIARQSRLVLDNVGLLVSVKVANENYAKSLNRTVASLTDQERKIAFRNEALDQAKKKIADLGGVQLNAGDAATRSQVAFSNLVTQLQKVLARSGAVADIFNSMADRLDKMTDGVANNENAWIGWTGVTIQAIKGVSIAFVALFRVAFNVGQMIGRASDIASSSLVIAWLKAFDQVKIAANAMIEGLNKVPLIDIKFRFDTGIGPVQEFLIEGIKDQTVALKGDVADLADTVKDVFNAWVDVEAAIIRARLATGGADLTPSFKPPTFDFAVGGTGGIGAPALPDVDPFFAQFRLAQLAFAEQQKLRAAIMENVQTFDITPSLALAAAEEKTADWNRQLAAVAETMEGRLAQALAAIAVDFKNIGDTVRNLAQLITQELVKSLVAAKLAGQSLAGVMNAFGPIGIGLGVLGVVSQFFQKGGVVQSIGSSDGAVPIMAHAGEVVLSRSTVAKLGGPEAANALNAGGAAVAGPAPTSGSTVVRFEMASMPEPADFGILASRAQAGRLFAAMLRNHELNTGAV